MIIYTDLDYVLHHYTPDILDVCYSLFGRFDISASECDRLSFDSPFCYAKKKVPLSEEMIDKAVFKVDEDFCRWLPTDWGRTLAEALKQRVTDHGDELRVITARSSWRYAIKIVNEMFGEGIPLYACESKNKHLIIEDNSILFEDHAGIINNTLGKNPNTFVIYPLWAWNRGKIKTEFSSRAMPMKIDQWDNIDQIIEATRRRIDGKKTAVFP